MTLVSHMLRQISWSRGTFGPGVRPGIVDHIEKELKEIEEKEYLDLEEWIDVVILGLDGAWRCLPEAFSDATKAMRVVRALKAKQRKNEKRVWPDWRIADRNKAIEHDRSKD